MAVNPNTSQVGIRKEDDATLQLSTAADGGQKLELLLGDKAIETAVAVVLGKTEAEIRALHLLAEYDPATRVLTTYPTVTKRGSNSFLDPKYGFEWIAFENADPIQPAVDESCAVFSEIFPTGFHPDPFDGLGVFWPVRFIFETLEQVSGVRGIIMCDDAVLSSQDGVIRFPKKIFDRVRRAIRRGHDAALEFANEDKVAYLRSELLPPLLPAEQITGDYRRSVSELRDTVSDAINSPGKPRLKHATEAAAARTVRRAAREIAKESPVELYQLVRTIELVTFEDLIAKFEAKLSEKLSEEHWQQFLLSNPFILRSAFALPITVFGDQVSVGGTGFKGGGKIADFVVKSGLMGNVSIVEIKKPTTQLVRRTPYRGKVHAPTEDLAGGVNQVLDQRFRLQQEINQKKVNDEIYDVYAYAVSCLLIIGRTPATTDQRKSFDLFRNTLAGVTVVTFDELLAKLKALHDFLRAETNSADPPVARVDDAGLEDEDIEDDLEEVDLDDDIQATTRE
jgi:antiviral defense system Shedu protein SduA